MVIVGDEARPPRCPGRSVIKQPGAGRIVWRERITSVHVDWHIADLIDGVRWIVSMPICVDHIGTIGFTDIGYIKLEGNQNDDFFFYHNTEFKFLALRQTFRPRFMSNKTHHVHKLLFFCSPITTDKFLIFLDGICFRYVLQKFNTTFGYIFRM